MLIFSYCFKIFELHLDVVSFTINYLEFLTLNTNNIYKYERFLIYCNAERETSKENFIAVNKIIFQK